MNTKLTRKVFLTISAPLILLCIVFTASPGFLWGSPDIAFDTISGLSGIRTPYVEVIGKITKLSIWKAFDGSLFAHYQNGCMQQIRMCEFGNKQRYQGFPK